MFNLNAIGTGTILILKPVPLACINFNLALDTLQYPYEVCDIPCCCRKQRMVQIMLWFIKLGVTTSWHSFHSFKKNSLHRTKNVRKYERPQNSV
jgi:hypothetical protein